MADEITVKAGLKGEKSGRKFDRPVETLRFDQSGADGVTNIQVIPTTANGTAFVVPAAIGTCGWALFKNLDATNYVEVGVQSGGTFYPTVKLKAGEVALFRLASNAPYGLANTGSVSVEYTILED